MKKIVIALLALAANPMVHAMPTTQAKVITVKEWATNNAKINFHIKPMLKNAFDEVSTRYTRVSADTKAQHGTTNSPNTFTSTGGVDLFNDTDETQTMYFTISVCIESDNPQSTGHFESQCGYHYESVSVPMHSSYTKDFSPELIVNFANAGNYHLNTYAFAYFNDEPSSFMDKRFTASSSANITVTD